MQSTLHEQTQAPAARWQFVGVGLALGTYVLAFAFFYPLLLTISDEAAYVRQAAAFARGQATVAVFEPETMRDVQVVPSDYPPGTSLLMTPFVAVFGWRGAFIPGLLALCFTVMLLAHWLWREGRSPLFALLFMTYLPTLVMARCGMSDLPSAAVVSLALYLFWFANARPAWLAGSGLIAGASLLLRETNALLCAVFFLAALLRRERGMWLLVLCGLAGSSLRLLFSWVVTGDFLFVKQTHPQFSLFALGANAPFHLAALLILLPGGLAWVALYRGRKRAELIITVLAFVVLYLLYDYNAANSGGLKQWVLSSRFFIPLLPLMIVAMAEALPRLSRAAVAPLGVQARVTVARLSPLVWTALVLLTCTLCGAAHWQHWLWASDQKMIQTRLLAATSPETPVFTNLDATRKYFNEVYAETTGARSVISLDALNDAMLDRLLKRFGATQIAIVTRNDSAYWRTSSEARLRQVEDLKGRYALELVCQSPVPSGEVVSVWIVRARK